MAYLCLESGEHLLDFMLEGWFPVSKKKSKGFPSQIGNRIGLVENGPFKSLTGVWRFTPLETQACIISLHFEFEFSNKLLDMALGGLFKQLCDP